MNSICNVNLYPTSRIDMMLFRICAIHVNILTTFFVPSGVFSGIRKYRAHINPAYNMKYIHLCRFQWWYQHQNLGGQEKVLGEKSKKNARKACKKFTFCHFYAEIVRFDVILTHLSFFLGGGLKRKEMARKYLGENTPMSPCGAGTGHIHSLSASP